MTQQEWKELFKEKLQVAEYAYIDLVEEIRKIDKLEDGDSEELAIWVILRLNKLEKTVEEVDNELS